MFRFLIITFVASAMAHHGGSHMGACPEVKPVENFNLSAYQGVWYEISKIPIESEGPGKCGQAEYKLEGDVVKVKNSQVINSVQTYIEGTARFADDANNAAKFIVSFTFGGVPSDSQLMVLQTDYSGYSIAYNCKYDEKTKIHEEHAWILSRSKTLEGDAKNAVDNFLKENPKVIDSAKLVQSDFSEEACKFTSTSVMETPVAKP
ncbi:unnamed protein product [Arctia plantaginis]|uniref:Lipocalin/cytosolic fatty-acid binding domain-containing protein n=1 Tax=Arctia plantaginis TaxID=874455 RepID=A0A8S1AJF4_ARCPL|nr:unnamed protein product [Arctia plantaginis]